MNTSNNQELILTIPKVCHPELDEDKRIYWAENEELLNDWKRFIQIAIDPVVLVDKNFRFGKFSQLFVEYYFNDDSPREKMALEPLYIKNALELWGLINKDTHVKWKIILNARENKTMIYLGETSFRLARRRGIKYFIDEARHEAIRKVYLENTGSGQVRDLAKRLGLPRWKITRYAIKQGWTAKQHKEPNWNDTELRILERNAHLQPEAIQRHLKVAGFRRSCIGIVLRRSRSNFLKNLSGQSAMSLAICLGVDIHFVTKAINQGRLEAGRRGTKRTEKQGGDQWFIKDPDIKNYIKENVHEIDFRKVDKYWLVSILT